MTDADWQAEQSLAADHARDDAIDKVRIEVRAALRCLEELEDAAMHNKRRRVPNFNENNERRSQLSAARVALDHALARLG